MATELGTSAMTGRRPAQTQLAPITTTPAGMRAETHGAAAAPARPPAPKPARMSPTTAGDEPFDRATTMMSRPPPDAR